MGERIMLLTFELTAVDLYTISFFYGPQHKKCAPHEVHTGKQMIAYVTVSSCRDQAPVALEHVRPLERLLGHSAVLLDHPTKRQLS